MNPIYQTIFAIDPGNTESAWIEYKPATRCIAAFAKERNEAVLRKVNEVGSFAGNLLAIEMIASYGMPVGREVFETCVWIGRFIEAWGGEHRKIYRKDVKLHLCNSVRAKDGNIRQALIDRIGPQGVKKSPGPTYGISKDVWSALAVAVCCADSLRLEAA